MDNTILYTLVLQLVVSAMVGRRAHSIRSAALLPLAASVAIGLAPVVVSHVLGGQDYAAWQIYFAQEMLARWGLVADDGRYLLDTPLAFAAKIAFVVATSALIGVVLGLIGYCLRRRRPLAPQP
jgi:hypothetical protein